MQPQISLSQIHKCIYHFLHLSLLILDIFNVHLHQVRYLNSLTNLFSIYIQQIDSFSKTKQVLHFHFPIHLQLHLKELVNMLPLHLHLHPNQVLNKIPLHMHLHLNQVMKRIPLHMHLHLNQLMNMIPFYLHLHLNQVIYVSYIYAHFFFIQLIYFQEP